MKQQGYNDPESMGEVSMQVKPSFNIPMVYMWHVPVLGEEMCMSVPVSAHRPVHIVKQAGIKTPQCRYEITVLTYECTCSRK